ncbi:alpha/beta hydrolase [Paenibacillus barcinonensis]|uniref:Alpha/beta hydrolase n=1 Tax=Paenibacillus barcinonensis TaxID=198119 RepID=A0A2V4VT32_PAEBA|nr:alpha/beta hydrolase [Paenibacillus barcinonensis]PYE45438.1 pimeloyl-ACP methyl ester carboxylesterase [Paenibacillus barcinonensis]QKS55254.1 alpha/beta hydrolase [Paenibacillus barcinonensis]
MNRLNVNGIELVYDSYGDEKHETMLLIAGLATQMLRWTTPFCEMLAARGYRVIRFDNRDTGLSTHFSHHDTLDFEALARTLMSGQRPHIPYTLEDMSDDTVGLLDALGIEKAHIVGRSMGGMIAQLVASRYPERVLSLTSIMSTTGNPELPPTSPEVMALMTRPAPNPREHEAGYLAQSTAFARQIAGTGYPFNEGEYHAMIRAEVRRAYDPGSIGRQIAAIAVSGDRRPQLAKIDVPTLVIHGAEDPMFVPACGEDTAKAILGSELMVLEGMGHDLPEQLYETVIDGIVQTAQRNKGIETMNHRQKP